MSKRPGRGWWWLLWPWALCAEPRDPFAPPPLPACAQTAASPAGWRLKGVIGQPTLRYGWVVTPADNGCACGRSSGCWPSAGR